MILQPYRDRVTLRSEVVVVGGRGREGRRAKGDDFINLSKVFMWTHRIAHDELQSLSGSGLLLDSIG